MKVSGIRVAGGAQTWRRWRMEATRASMEASVSSMGVVCEDRMRESVVDMAFLAVWRWLSVSGGGGVTNKWSDRLQIDA
jgi:hypothetical protein